MGEFKYASIMAGNVHRLSSRKCTFRRTSGDHGIGLILLCPWASISLTKSLHVPHLQHAGGGCWLHRKSLFAQKLCLEEDTHCKLELHCKDLISSSPNQETPIK